MGYGGFIVYLVGLAIGIVIWFFLNRASVRANRQIELLESIERRLEGMTKIAPATDATKEKSAEDYLAEARKKAGV
ncbi:hypothetical protein M0K91_RS00040 [Serratia marcescens]|uniref:YebO family protein n=1 Tax=Serratia marcescens TaxID=615 RepID=UPI003F817A82|nr:hypothetical protein [Serratia marcescens]